LMTSMPIFPAAPLTTTGIGDWLLMSCCFSLTDNSTLLIMTSKDLLFGRSWPVADRLIEFIDPLLAAGYQVLAFDAPAHGSTIGEQSNRGSSSFATLT
jgi:hypothetical protein